MAKYYLLAGEASGDLHASRLMRALKERDAQAEFRAIGGDLMQAEGATLLRHYRDMAYMGFVPVLTHLHTIYNNMRACKRDIVAWGPDVVILVDYPGFNLQIAAFLKAKTNIPAVYYIAPKIWAWKEWRIKNIKRDISQLYSILPFEKDFFEGKHHYPIHYVGNPTAEEVEQFQNEYKETREQFCTRNGLDPKLPIIALLAGSRRQEIKDNLPTMTAAAKPFSDHQLVLAGAPAIDAEYYDRYIGDAPVSRVTNETYALLSHAKAALVTSGTATLETALLGVPQVVCYETPLPQLFGWLRRHVLRVPYISLVNLVAGREVVPELVADAFTEANIRAHLAQLLQGDARRQQMEGYKEVKEKLGHNCAPKQTAKLIMD